MKISHVRISNILGVDEFEFAPRAFTEISGQNGQGKTSILEAIRAAIRGGHDATLLRKGSDKGEVVLVLDNGDEIRRKITERASTVDVVRGGRKIPKPAESIRALTDLMAANPIDFLRAPAKDRARVLLESMPMKADADLLAQIAGHPVVGIESMHALQAIEIVHSAVYDERTGTNRAKREKEATINQLRASLPQAPAGGDLRAPAAISEELAALSGTLDGELSRIDGKMAGYKETHDAKLAALREQYEAAVAAENAEFASIREKAEAARKRAREAHAGVTAGLREELAAANALVSSAAARENTLATIKQLSDDVDDLEKDAAKQTAAIEALAKYKIDLLSALPIPGLEIIDGEVHRNGVHFDRLNTAQQVEIAIEVAKLRAGSLPIICVDGIEVLDGAHYEAFREKAEAGEAQFFVTRVSDDPLTVTTTQEVTS